LTTAGRPGPALRQGRRPTRLQPFRTADV
jgi:hypothetical protein